MAITCFCKLMSDARGTASSVARFSSSDIRHRCEHFRPSHRYGPRVGSSDSEAAPGARAPVRTSRALRQRLSRLGQRGWCRCRMIRNSRISGPGVARRFNARLKIQRAGRKRPDLAHRALGDYRVE